MNKHAMNHNNETINSTDNGATERNSGQNISMHDSSTMHDHGGTLMPMGNLKQKFWTCLILSIPVLILAPMFPIDSHLHFVGADWMVLTLSSFIYFYGGAPFLKGAKAELASKTPGMMTLISIGITISYYYSVYVFIILTFFNPSSDMMGFFGELVTLIDIMLLGHLVEMNALARAGNALQELAKLLPEEATIVEKGGTKVVPLSSIHINDVLLVRAGEKIPADGVVIQGSTFVDESLVTGESRSVSKKINSKVIGGSLNGDGAIEIRVTGAGSTGYLAQIVDLVSVAQQKKSQAEDLADKVAGWLVYVAVAVSILSFVTWLAFGADFNFALERLVTVVVIACPHALGLAIPLVIARSTSIAAKNGLLIKNREALERAKDVGVVFLDKTGTLTEGDFTVQEYDTFSEKYSKEEVLQLAASVSENSSHPLSTSIVEAAKSLSIEMLRVTDTVAMPGTGIKGEVGTQNVALVNEKYLKDNGINYKTEAITGPVNEGYTVSFILVDNVAEGYIAQGDRVKKDSALFIKKLKVMNITPVMVTGDNIKVAAKVGQEVGIDSENIYAEFKPEKKENLIREYQGKKFVTMMVGDGINDAPALARADVGVAIGAGTNVAIDSADVILVSDDPLDIINFLMLGKETTKKMIQNLWFGAGYNVVAIPLAAGVLAPFGLLLSPAVGGILMGVSTLLVAINAQTLKLVEITK